LVRSADRLGSIAVSESEPAHGCAIQSDAIKTWLMAAFALDLPAYGRDKGEKF
jgi:hypothetical protein